MDVLFAYVGMSITEKGNTLDTKGKHQTMVNKVQGGLSPPAHQEGGLVGEGEDCDRQGDVRPVAGAEAPLDTLTFIPPIHSIVGFLASCLEHRIIELR